MEIVERPVSIDPRSSAAANAADPAVRRLLERAFFACAGRDANLAIATVSDERAAAARQGAGILAARERGVSYEIVLTGRPWRWVADVVAPRLSYHLRCVRVARQSLRAVLPCFAGDALFFLTAADLFAAVQIEEGWSDADLSSRIARWERGIDYPDDPPSRPPLLA